MNGFWAHVDTRGPCWEWTASRSPKGYGKSSFRGKKWLAHRLAWTLLVGPIPDGMTLDHLCRNHACVNPDHLEPVSLKVNILRGYNANAINARKTHCKRGHPFNESSIESDGHRRCRQCRTDRERARRRRLREG